MPPRPRAIDEMAAAPYTMRDRCSLIASSISLRPVVAGVALVPDPRPKSTPNPRFVKPDLGFSGVKGSSANWRKIHKRGLS